MDDFKCFCGSGSGCIPCVHRRSTRGEGGTVDYSSSSDFRMPEPRAAAFCYSERKQRTAAFCYSERKPRTAAFCYFERKSGLRHFIILSENSKLYF